MDYELLETFVVLCENRNITQTARQLYKTQPTVSGRIKLLEEKLGFSLIVRSKGKKTVEITKRGLEFLPIAQKFLNLYEEINIVQKQLSRTLLVSTIPSLSVPIVADVFHQLLDKEPSLTLSLLTYQTEDAYDMVAKKELDMAFVSEARNVNGVTCEAIFSQDYYVVRRSSSPEGIKTIHTRELDVNFEIYQRWSDQFDLWHKNTFNLQKPSICIDSCAMLKYFLTSPEYWAIIQKSNLSALSQELPLQIYTIADPPPVRVCYLLTNSYMDRNNAALIRQIRQMLRQYAFDNDLLLS